MQPQLVVGGAIAASLGMTMAFAACGAQTSTAPAGRPIGSAPSTSVPITSAPSAARTPPQPSAIASVTRPSDAALLAAAVAKARACDEPGSRILNHPDGGVVFNNAMTSADAGHIDRTRATLDAIAGQSRALRCCFDVWTRAHAGKTGKVLLVVTLAADGTVESTRVDKKRTDASEPVMDACLLAVVNAATYPPSPSKKRTIVEYPLVFGSAP